MNLVETLKQNGEDFEFYPTTKEMISCIWEHRQINRKQSWRADSFGSVLDIGCGTCNFHKWIFEFNKQEPNEVKRARIREYFVIEKSKTLIDLLDKDTIVLGTDFNETTLIDKKVDTIFCNPPYSEYVNWTLRIISESNATEAYLVIPERWKDNKEINRAIEQCYGKVEVLGSFDFLNAERQARAKVDVVFIEMVKNEDSAFDRFFDETFGLEEAPEIDGYKYEEEKSKGIKNQLVAGNKIERLVNFYNDELSTLHINFKTICLLNAELLQSIGVTKKSVKKSLKKRIAGLKVLYWQIVFDEMEEITSRLTSETRKNMVERFKSILSVDFTYDNIYSLIIWVIKNAKEYYNCQLISLFKQLSSLENIKKYKSNQKTFSKERWRWADDNTHYTLDYRIICDSLQFKDNYSWNNELYDYRVKTVISDFCAVANNLGFPSPCKEIAKLYGVKYNVWLNDKEILFEYKIFKNGNTHIKMNKEFAKALNVEASRLLGWIRDKSDIQKEFCDDMAEGADKYFNAQVLHALPIKSLKLLSNQKGQ